VDQYAAAYANGQTVWSSPTLAYGTHYLQVVTLGDKRPESTGTRVVVDAFRITGVPAVWRYDDADVRIVRNGTWTKTADTNMFGGTYYQTNSTGADVYVGFNGTRVDWVAPMAPNYGLAKVYIDGTEVATVDQYRSSYANKQTVWSSGTLTAGNHTLRIAVLGDKRSASTGTKIVVDAFDMIGVLTSTDLVPPQTAATIAPRYDRTATITLNPTDAGTGVLATRYRMDAGVWTTGTVAQTSVLGTHTIDYFSIDKAGNRETTHTAAFYVAARFDDASPSVAYTGTWYTQTDSTMWAGAYHHASTASASVEATFSGAEVAWIGPMTTSYGKANVFIDGVLVQEVDQYRASYANSQVVWTSGPLTDGVHTIKIEALGARNGLSTGNKIVVDALDLVGASPTLLP
jgi:hypothetical protein